MSFSFNIPFKVERGSGWTNPYITDGLVAMWDGEWNAGGGVHSEFPDKWVDLTGNGNDAYPSENPLMFDEDSLVYTGRTDVCCWSVNSLSDAMRTLASRPGKYYTMQMRIDIESGPNNAEVCSMPGSKGEVEAFSARTASGAVFFYGGVFNQQSFENVISNSFSYSCADLTDADGVKKFRWVGYRGDTALGYVKFKMITGQNGGQVVEANVSPKVFVAPLTFGYQGRTANLGALKARLHTVRFYDRELSEDEVRFNFGVDVERFGLPYAT